MVENVQVLDLTGKVLGEYKEVNPYSSFDSDKEIVLHLLFL
jgi:hypothetical protein